MKKRLLTYLTTLLTTAALYGTPYDVLVDKDFSPYAGGQDLLTGLGLLELAEDNLLPPKEQPKIGFFPILGRYLEMALIWDPLADVVTTTQHEVFGHGYRIRELPDSHAKVQGYRIGVPFPYSLEGGGATNYTLSDKMTLAEFNAVTIAGIEAQEILARQLKMKWISNGKIDARTSKLYFISQQSLFFYTVASLDDKLDAYLRHYGDDPFDGNDVKSYVYWMNQLYPEDRITLHYIRGQAYYNWLDAFTYYSLYAWVNYVITGKQFSFPMIPLGKVKFLPGFKVTLAPYGLEKNLEGFFSLDGTPLYTYVKWGDHGGVSYFGGGIDYDQVITWKKGIFGFKLDIWNQPDFLQATTVTGVLEGKEIAATPGLKKKVWGAAGSLIARYNVGKETIPFYLYAEAGYKTKGYLPGYTLEKGFVGRFGFSTKF